MKAIKHWWTRRKAIKAADALVRQGEYIKAIKAYRCTFDPIAALSEAVRAVDKIRERHGVPRS